MTTHVLIVNNKTFKYHLQYLFAGIGNKDKEVKFLTKDDATIHSSTERIMVGMIADISRIKKNDNIIFYVQANKCFEGRFYGIFKAESNAFLDENDNDNYLKNELNKGLTFRIKIKPSKEVYAEGITEHEYLDNLSGKEKPYQLCWSLIYRKLKGNRGCTMITDYEFNDLLIKLRKKNHKKVLDCTSKTLTFDLNTYKIAAIDDNNCHYEGRMDSLEIGKRLCYKANHKNAFETHLQAYILQNSDNSKLKKLLFPLPDKDYWIGNEVSCGVGMQRMDILIKQEDEKNIFIKVIELKDEEPTESILDFQLPWYLQWLSEYFIPNYITKSKNIHVIPSIIAKSTQNENFLHKLSNISFNHSIANADVLPVEFIKFNIIDNEIKFEREI